MIFKRNREVRFSWCQYVFSFISYSGVLYRKETESLHRVLESVFRHMLPNRMSDELRLSPIDVQTDDNNLLSRGESGFVKCIAGSVARRMKNHGVEYINLVDY